MEMAERNWRLCEMQCTRAVTGIGLEPGEQFRLVANHNLRPERYHRLPQHTCAWQCVSCLGLLRCAAFLCVTHV